MRLRGSTTGTIERQVLLAAGARVVVDLISFLDARVLSRPSRPCISSASSCQPCSSAFRRSPVHSLKVERPVSRQRSGLSRCIVGRTCEFLALHREAGLGVPLL